MLMHLRESIHLDHTMSLSKLASEVDYSLVSVSLMLKITISADKKEFPAEAGEIEVWSDEIWFFK